MSRFIAALWLLFCAVTARFPDGRVVRSNSKVGEVVWRDPVVHSEENVGNDIGAQLIRRGTVA